MTLTIELSEKAKENIERNQWLRRKQSKFISIENNSYVILIFDPEKIEQIEKEAFGTKMIRYKIHSRRCRFKESRENI